MATILKRALRDGTPHYKAIVRRKGAPTRAKTFRTREQANAWITKTEATILDRKQFTTATEERRTVADLIEEYRTHVLPTLTPGTQRPRAIHLTW